MGMIVCSDSCWCAQQGPEQVERYTIDGTKKEVSVNIVAQPCKLNDNSNQCCGSPVDPQNPSNIVGCGGGDSGGGALPFQPNLP